MFPRSSKLCKSCAISGGQPVGRLQPSREHLHLHLHSEIMNTKKMKRHLSSPRFGNSSPTHSTEHPRRMSIQENFAQLTRSLSALRLIPRKDISEGWELFGIALDKDKMENILASHYGDTSLKVKFLFLSH